MSDNPTIIIDPRTITLITSGVLPCADGSNAVFLGFEVGGQTFLFPMHVNTAMGLVDQLISDIEQVGKTLPDDNGNGNDEPEGGVYQ